MPKTRESYAIATPDGRFLEVADGFQILSPRFGSKEEAYAQIREVYRLLTDQYLLEPDRLPQYVVVRQVQTISDWESVDSDDLTTVTLIGDRNDNTD